MRSYLLMTRNGLLLIAAALLFSGCASAPKNAEEFRQEVRNAPSFLNLVDTFEVERPFQDVSTTLRKKGDECLKITINWTITASGQWNTRSGVNTYKPIFVANASKAELHVKLKRTDVIEVGSPPDGFYRVVLDATPIAKNRTRIDMYTRSSSNSLLRKALRGWAQGDNLGCPHL